MVICSKPETLNCLFPKCSFVAVCARPRHLHPNAHFVGPPNDTRLEMCEREMVIKLGYQVFGTVLL
jgi:hypothetical protein